jgi:pectinesterase
MSDENTAEVVERGNAFVGTSGEVVTRGAAFEPPYQYTMDQAEAIKDLVLAGAGAR